MTEKLDIVAMQTTVKNVTSSVVEYFTKGDGTADFASNRAWTTQIFNQLAQEAKKLGYTVCSSRLNDYQDQYGEWLFDHCWIKWTDDDPVRLKDVILVLESEWDVSYIAIMNDFEKLLVARADLRVMLFQQPNEKRVKDVFNKLHAAIAGFSKSVANDEYLFCGYIISERKFIYKSDSEFIAS